MSDHALLDRHPGSHAQVPTDIPRKGWVQILRRTRAEMQRDQVPLIAAGVAFYAFLALFPALIAALLLYGLVRTPAEIQAQAASWTDSLPADAATVITSQLDNLARTDHQSLGIGLVVALLLALWGAAGGVGNLITAVNIAYDEEETRSFLHRKALALALTLGAIVFVVLVLGLVAVAPAVLDHVVGSGPARWGLEAARWTVLVLAMSSMLAVLYRVAPDRQAPRVSWVSVGAVAATVVWVLVSLGFSLYVDNFGSYARTYGALAGVVVLLLWLWITMLVVLLGAELNAEAEQQTHADTTSGPPQPFGHRGAVKADTVLSDTVRADDAVLYDPPIHPV